MILTRKKPAEMLGDTLASVEKELSQDFCRKYMNKFEEMT